MLSALRESGDGIMVFSSLTFLYVFLPLVLVAYYIAPMKGKNIIILISGILFYAWGEPFYVFLMLFSITVDYTMGRLIDRFDDKPKLRTLFLLASLIINLGLLCVFKYSSFLVQNINGLFGLQLFDPQLPLPIGISFYTFQSLSYTIDLYMRNIKVQKNIVSYISYVTLFPQIVAGPIVRYQDIANEIDHREITMSKVSEGIRIFLIGLGKKVLLANNIGALWTAVKGMELSEISTVTAWLGILAFTFQIYFDFSGYSDMAVGLGKMLGFEFPKNFNYPYLSRSISEFWRRWHITLGTWFRCYVYIPLGGNRHGTLKTLRNLLIVWFLTGLWHGASWNFILWGLYFGLLIILERLFLGKLLEKLPAALSTAYSFLLVVIGWVIFETESIPRIFAYLKAMFFGSSAGFADAQAVYFIATYGIVFLICILAATDYPKKLVEGLQKNHPKIVQGVSPIYQLALMVASTAYLVYATYNPFLYFRF